MFVRSNHFGIEYLHSTLLGRCGFLEHAFCMRHGGVSGGDYHSLNMSYREGDDEFHVLQNWNLLASAFRIPVEKFLVLNQVHGNGVLVIETKDDLSGSRETLQYDATVTHYANLAICIKTADCLPVFVVDPKNKAIAAVHAGWRGTALGITAGAVQVMRDRYGSRPDELLAAVGPSIGPCCYEVDSAVADQFKSHADRDLFFHAIEKKGRWMLNLLEANLSQLRRAGLSDARIDTAGICTVCQQNDFFSHRGSGGVTGRQINFLMIRQEEP